jgi:hypothetical protein
MLSVVPFNKSSLVLVAQQALASFVVRLRLFLKSPLLFRSPKFAGKVVLPMQDVDGNRRCQLDWCRL